MVKFSLNDSIDSVYSVVDKKVLGIKASVINLCSDIDRYFRLVLSIDICDYLDEEQYDMVIGLFPSLSCMSIEQFNRFINMIKNIRTINAHLHLRKPIFIDDDLEYVLSSLVKPQYKVRVNNKLTMYGQMYVLIFISQKYNLWPFITSYYRNAYFDEIERGIQQNNKQVEIQHLFQNFCGIGKPIVNDKANSREEQYMNEQFKYYLSRFIFSFERTCFKTRKTFSKVRSLKSGLFDCYEFDNDEEASKLLVLFRNCWFHGNNLNDTVEYDGEIIKLDYEFIFNAMIKIKKCLLHDHIENHRMITELNNFALECFNFYALRIIELSYKVLDSRLLSSDKIDSRIENLQNAFDRFNKVNPKFFELISNLVEPDDLVFYVTASKFADNLARITSCSNLKIYKIHSDSGIRIGDYYSPKKDLYIANIDLDNVFVNKINGFELNELVFCNEIKIGKKISIYDVEIVFK